jgi:hypothetical protein
MLENAKPAGVSGGHREISVSDWKAYQKNTLLGFLPLTLPSRLLLHNCSLHQENGARWIGLPSRQYTKGDGSTSFMPLIDFTTKEARQRFQTAALEAVDRHMGGSRDE